MNEQVCTKAVDTCGYPVETTGNAVLDTLEHRSSTRAFARDDDDRPVAVTDEQRAAILHAASRAPSAGAMMMYSIVSIREQATLDRLADLCDHQPMIAKAPWALIFVVDYAKWIDLFEHVGCFEPEFVERTGKAPRRAPGLGDFAIAAQDAVIAAQNAVVAAEALGLGSCYIGDIVENAEEVAELLDLPLYTMPLSMLIIGTSLGAISVRAALADWRVYVVSAVRLLVCPLLTWLVLRPFVSGALLGIPVLLAACPSAMVVTALCLQYDRSDAFASKCIFLNTILSAVTIPLLIWLLF